jgi:hypothetical protein
VALHLRIDPGAALPEQALAEMRALRASVLPLQPSVDPTDDAARFDAVIRRATHVARLVDRTGTLLAMGTIRRERLELPDCGPVIELGAEYLAAHRRVRGGPGLLWGAWRAMVRIGFGAREPGPRVLTAVAYPGSLLLLGTLGPVTLWGEAAAPAERALLQRLRDANASRWHPARACVAMPTRPVPPTPGWRERTARDPLYGRYLARCPDWEGGWGLPIAVRIDPIRATWALARDGTRRWWATHHAAR